MAYTPWDTYMDTVPVPSTVEELQQALQIKYNTSWQNIADTLTSYGADPNNFDTLANLCNVKSISSADGKATAWYYGDLIDDFSFTPNPNVSTDSYTSITHVRTPMNTTIDDVTGKVTVSNTPQTGQFTQNAAYLMGEVGQAASAASVGVSLGKTLSSLIYEVAPRFFPDGNWETFDPDTWGAITAGDDSLGADLFNFIFGIDPQTGAMQAYMDSDAFAYFAYALAQKNFFSTNYDTPALPSTYVPDKISIDGGLDLAEAVNIFVGPYSTIFNNGVTRFGWTASDMINAIASAVPNYNDYVWVCEGDQVTPHFYGFTLGDHICRAFSDPYGLGYNIRGVVELIGHPNTSTDAFEIYRNFPDSMWVPTTFVNGQSSGVYVRGSSSQYAFANGLNTTITSGVEGVGDQPNAQLPDISTWTDVPSTDTYLRSAYPNMYNDALQYDNLQPDGTVLTKTYIPVSMPQNLTSPDTQNLNDPWNNTQPTSDGASQTTTLVDPSTSPDDFLKQLIKTITQTVQITNTDNPTTTGTGDSAPLVPIAGTSTALWSVYNPTKSQIDSFGAWLWTDNVIQQFIQLLNNPMEGIITLHKVFATPVISGTGTIVVGRLDSGVGSNLVAQQYVTVDCGSVRLDECFGNVFDYSPHTTISLYLPFIGFVPLNVDDVMRSTISISYGVDVFTGACLATVNVDRDGYSVGLYQYSGVASVEYPLTGAQHGGLVNGLLGVAGGVAGIAFASTGVGVVAGASSIAGGLANAAKTSNARSGGFSGNAGAMGVKIPYLIIERPITKVAETFSILDGYPTNYSVRLGDCANHVVCKTAHVYGINATQPELEQIENYLLSGVEI